MGREETKRWIEAGKALARDPAARVKCPRCEKGALTLREYEAFEGAKERVIRCDKCGARQFMRMPAPGA
jgi:DNA-directed RNA polymerase subunit RPC12/RpoP